MAIETAINGDIDWNQICTLPSYKYKCGYCDQPISSNIGYTAKRILRPESFEFGKIYICHYCGKPSFIDNNGLNHPGELFGNVVNHIENRAVNELYNEARACMKVNAYTSAVMCCRKLIVNIAVNVGAKEGLNFVQYVDYLADENYVPKNAKDMLEAIRRLGNEAVHEIHTKSKMEAELAIKFLEMILKLMYEFPFDVKSLTHG